MPLPADPLKWAVNAFRDNRNARYQTYADYIDGDQPLAFASDKFRSAFGRLFDAFAYNRCEMVVDAHADRLRVEGIGADNDQVQQAAQDLWDANSMDRRAGHLQVDAFGLGDGYVIVEMHPERERVHLWMQDPRNMRVHYADDIPGELDLAAKAWIDPDTEHARMNLYFADRVEKYVTQQRAPSGIPTSANSFVRFEVEGEDQGFELGVKGTVPVFHAPNNGRTNAYGRSEIASVIPLQDAINKSFMDLFVASEFMAFPQRVFMGMMTPETDEEKAKFAKIEAGMTRAITLEDPSARIGEFSAADLKQYLGVIEFIDTAISRTTKVPAHYLSGIPAGTSGRSLRAAETAYIAKLRDRSKDRGEVLCSALAYGLQLGGFGGVTPGDLRVNWAPIEPSTEEDVWDLIMQKRAAGMALMSALREAGYDPEQIQVIQDEMDENARMMERQFNAGVIARQMYQGATEADADDETQA